SAEVLSQFQELRDLNLYRSRITNAGLAKLQSLKKLEMLDLRYSGVTSAGVQAFHSAVPKCKITFVDSAPRVSRSKNAAPPRGAGEPAIAQWLQAMGGQVRMSGNKIQSISGHAHLAAHCLQPLRNRRLAGSARGRGVFRTRDARRGIDEGDLAFRYRRVEGLDAGAG